MLMFEKMKMGATIPTESLLKNVKCGNKKLRNKVFIRLLELVMTDLVEKGIQFDLPAVNKHRSYFCVDLIPEQKFKELYKQGKYRFIDWFITNCTAYKLALIFSRPDGSLKKIHVGVRGYLYDRFINLINSGKRY